MVSLLPGRFRRRGPAVSGSAVRVAVVGAGTFASRTWYPLLRSMRGVKLSAACALSETRLAPLARRNRILAVFTDLGRMLDRERPEAVFAIVPSTSALTVAREVLWRGIPLCLDAPPGLSPLETREMADLALAHGAVSLVPFGRRHCPIIRAATSQISAAGGIQSVVVECHEERGDYEAGGDWVGGLIDQLDLLRHLGGEVSEVAAMITGRSDSGRTSHACHALLRFASGGVAVLAAFRSAGARRERIEIHGPGISAEIHPPERALLLRACGGKAQVIVGRTLVRSRDPLEISGLASQVRCFLEAVRGGPTPPTNLADAALSMELVERIREAARTRTLSMVSTSAPETPVVALPRSPEWPDIAPLACSEQPAIALLLSPEVASLVLPQHVRDRLAGFARILETVELLDRRETARLLEQADGAITSWRSPRLTAEMSLRSRRLRIIAHAGGSARGVVDEAFLERGVQLTNASSAIAPSVGEMALALTLAGLRSLTRYDREARKGLRKPFLGAPSDSRGLFGRRVGLVGFGRTGREFVRLLAPFACEILAYDPAADPSRLAASGVRAAALEEVLKSCDVVSLHASYSAETHHLLNAERLALLQDGALLVNTATGALVDEAALAALLRTGRIAAALDVTTVEPLPSGAELTTLPNVILTPHIAGPTFERLPELGRTAVEDLQTFFAGGSPRNLVSGESLARAT